MLQNLFQSFLITAEKPQIGLAITLIAGCTNMVLDWILVGICGLGIAGAASTMNSVAQGNFNLHSKIGQIGYVGAYQELDQSLRALKTGLSETLRAVVDASGQVDAGASQLAKASVDLAEGASNQAGAVEELFATVSDVTEQVERNNSATALANEKIIGEIEEIASQTNLLSLNASIEAARAGEAGRKYGNTGCKI